MEKTRKKPYLTGELFDIVFEQLKKNGKVPENLIDYANGESKNDSLPMKTDAFDFIISTTYGGNEGIYTDIHLFGNIQNNDYCQMEYKCGVIKTLNDDGDSYCQMCQLGAEFYLAATKFVREHDDDFTWTGYELSYYLEDGQKAATYWVTSYEYLDRNIARFRSMTKKKPAYAIIIDCETGKEEKTVFDMEESV